MADSFGIRPSSLQETVTGQGRKKTPPLSEQQFFHGTTAALKPGDQLLPSSKTGKENYDYDYLPEGNKRRNSVFSDASEEGAWRWASAGSHNRFSGGRPVVYKVQPQGERSPDSVIGNAIMTPTARVQDRIDIPPPSVQDSGDLLRSNAKFTPGGVQGTLPPVNWKQFGEPGNGVDYSKWMPGGEWAPKENPVRDPNQGQLF